MPLRLLTMVSLLMWPAVGQGAAAGPALAAVSTPSPYTAQMMHLDAIETHADATSKAAASRNWAGARRGVDQIAAEIAAFRTHAGRGRRTVAFAQSLDASAKRLSSAVDRKDEDEVKQATSSLRTAVHELRETVRPA